MDLETTYVQLEDGGAARPIEVTETFWQDIGTSPELQAGRLVMRFSFSTDWSDWERHPNGDEVVCLIEGSVDFVLDRGGREEIIALRAPGSFAIVPRGVWHTARVHAPASMIFITAGEGTEHRPA
jgi:quercetin dioxygenase-like cupin family protein